MKKKMDKLIEVSDAKGPRLPLRLRVTDGEVPEEQRSFDPLASEVFLGGEGKDICDAVFVPVFSVEPADRCIATDEKRHAYFRRPT